MKRIFMLSSYPLFSQAVESLLRPETELAIVGRETDVDKATERIKELQPDVVIVDSGDPTSDPTAAVMRILGLRSGIRVIGLNLQDNTICIYRGEQRIARAVEDLVEAIKGHGFGSDPVSAEEWAAEVNRG